MPRSLLQRLGLAGGECDARLVWGLLLACLALYALGYAAFYPRVLTNTDEVEYLEETRALLETGSVVVPKEDPRTGLMRNTVPGDYPVGMVAMMAPFVATLGWRGAFLRKLLALLVAVLASARWLQQERRSPIFALILLGFPALLVVGRLALSDGARTAVAAVGLLLFFRGLDRERARSWLASGFVAGAALSLRESAVLPFIPLFAGSVLRWDRGWGWLLVGGLAGTALHAVSNSLVFGDAMFVRGANVYPFAPETLLERLPLYLFGLLVLVPGGLALGFAYRGRRQQELLASDRAGLAVLPVPDLRQHRERFRQAPRDRAALLRAAAAGARVHDVRIAAPSARTTNAGAGGGYNSGSSAGRGQRPCCSGSGGSRSPASSSTR